MYSNDSLTSPVPLNAPSNPLYLLRLHHLLTASVLSNIQSHLSPLLPLHLSPFHFVLSLLLVFLLSYQHSPPLTLCVSLYLYRSSSTLVYVSLPPHLPVPMTCFELQLVLLADDDSQTVSSVYQNYIFWAQCIQAVDSC